MERILVVDDEKEIADLIEVYLQYENYIVFKCNSAQEALHCIKTQELDLAIIDIMMPEIDGLTLCKEIRKSHIFPIIMLTAKGSELDKINGLTLGADDYVTKPFKPLELMARVKAQIRRYTQFSRAGMNAIESSVLEYEGLLLDTERYECFVDGAVVDLTPTEFSILRLLMENKGKVVSAETLFQGVWKDECYNKNSSTMTVHIRHIREKLNDTGEKPVYIKTVWGVGYRI